MQSIKKWSINISSSIKQPSNIIFTEDGLKIIISIGNDITVYDTSTGKKLKDLTGHTFDITCLCSLSNNGFVSGGKDKSIIIWSSNLRKLLKYTHKDEITSIASSSQDSVLTCTKSDFGLFQIGGNQVPKFEVESSILSSGWSKDDEMFALGFKNGRLSIRLKTGIELRNIDLQFGSIKAMLFACNSNLTVGLAVVNDSINFVSLEGKALNRLKLDSIPTSICKIFTQNFVLIANSILSLDGFNIYNIGIAPTDLVTSMDVGSSAQICHISNTVMELLMLEPLIAKSSHQNITAHSESLTDVVVQDLNSKQSFRIKCFQLVELISVSRLGIAIKIKDLILYYTKVENTELCFKFNNSMRCNEKIESLKLSDESISISSNGIIKTYDLNGISEDQIDTSPQKVLISNQMSDKGSKTVLVAKEYLKAKQVTKAVRLLCQKNEGDLILEIITEYPEAIDQKLIEECIRMCQNLNNPTLYMELLKLSKEYRRLLETLIKKEMWKEAYKLALPRPELHQQLYNAHGNWLLKQAKYKEAHDCYLKVNLVMDCFEMYMEMAKNASNQFQFKKASKFYWQVSTLCNPKETELFFSLSKLYHCYDVIYNFVHDPFTLSSPKKLLNHSKYVLNYLLNNDRPANISFINVLYCAAKSSWNLKCFKFCRYVCSLLLLQKLPKDLKSEVNKDFLLVQSKPDLDDHELMPICYNCMAENPFFQAKLSNCTNCSQPFVYSMHSFEILPLVEFELDDTVALDEAREILSKDPATELDLDQVLPKIFDRQMLLQCHNDQVLIIEGRNAKSKFYIMKLDLIVKCPSCHSFYTDEEWNHLMMVEGSCLICKNTGHEIKENHNNINI